MDLTHQPLRYQISSWRQLPKCISNNSRELHIRVTDLMQNFMLSGIRIQVEHDRFGVLFACVINATGNLITPEYGNSQDCEFTPNQILTELARYGFFIKYEPRSLLTGDQLQYLMTLKNLHFDKIRRLGVRHVARDITAITSHIVAFTIKDNPKWIDNCYEASDEEFTRALHNGTVIDISTISETQKYDWSWLDYVANIDDILQDNAEISLQPDKLQ